MEKISGQVRDIVLNPPQNPIKPELGEVTRLNWGSFKVAEKLAQGGQWEKAAAHYQYFTRRHSGEKEIEGYTGMIQMAINIGDFSRADQLVEEVDDAINILEHVPIEVEDRLTTTKAWAQEMVGKVDDALDSLWDLPEGRLTDGQRSHRNHFLGRAYLLQSLIPGQLDELRYAVHYFETDLSYQQSLPDTELNQAFNHIWLARCHDVLGPSNRSISYKHAEQAHGLLEPRNGLSEYWQWLGETMAREANYSSAIEGFASAYQELKGSQHHTAKAEAAWGLTKALSAQGEGELAASWANYALVTYPYVTTRLYI